MKITSPELEMPLAKAHWEELKAKDANRKIRRAIDKTQDLIPEVRDAEFEIMGASNERIAEGIDDIGQELFTKEELAELEKNRKSKAK